MSEAEQHQSPAESGSLAAFTASLSYVLDDVQRLACERVAQGSSVLFAAPTGAGKTTVAEFAIFAALARPGTRVFYTTPIKALSNQKFHELRSRYGEAAVGLLTGDTNIRGNAEIVVMTTEVLRNMMYTDPDSLANLETVILDEVHYLGDRSRGPVWEEVILHLPAHVRIVALSATVSNTEEFGDWLHEVRGDTEVVVSEHRPVPLYQHVLTRHELLPLTVGSSGRGRDARLNPAVRSLAERRRRSSERNVEASRGRGGRNGRNGRERYGRRARVRGDHTHRQQPIRRVDVAVALDEARLLPAIMFIFSRTGCDQAVRQCVTGGVRLTSGEERAEIRRVAEFETRELSPEDRRVLGVREWISALELGIAAHHAGLLPTMKTVVEQLFQRRLVKLVFATETLALGINMPAKSVVIERLVKFNGEERVPLTSGEYTQLTGRAGRRGIDTEGHAVVVWDDRIDVDSLAHLAGARSFPVNSTFVPTANMTVNLLARMPRSEARDTLERSFAQFQVDRTVVGEAESIAAQRRSLEGYEAAIERTSGAERATWERRASNLRRSVRRATKRLHRETSSLANRFDQYLRVLEHLGHLRADEHAPDRWIVTASGKLLQRIYGERDLLVAECALDGLFDGLSAPEIAMACSVFVYEPRRAAESEVHLTVSARATHVIDQIGEHWRSINLLFYDFGLPQSEPPHAGLASAMYAWADGVEIAEVLGREGILVGDFVRWTKQTIDLLDQLMKATRAYLRDVDQPDASHVERQHPGINAGLLNDLKLARTCILRGIVRASMFDGVSASEVKAPIS